MAIKNILQTTKGNIIKNKWMSLATIFVISITFTLTTFAIGFAFFAKKAVSYYETKAQIMIYFKSGTPVDEIQRLKTELYDPGTIESIVYISEEEAVKQFMTIYKDEPELAETITVGTLPSSLEIKAISIDDLKEIISKINNEKKDNVYIEEVWYFEDVIDKIRILSKSITYGGIALVVALTFVTVALIVITIEFNITVHKNEIEIMQLVGGTDQYIRAPYIFEGGFYGIMGGLTSSIIMLLPWSIMLYFIHQSESSFLWWKQQLEILSMGFLQEYSLLFILGFITIQIVLGGLLGVLGSFVAIVKYLQPKQK